MTILLKCSLVQHSLIEKLKEKNIVNQTPHIQWTTRITETGITNLTRITNKMATSSDYLMKYFSGILAVLLE